MAGRTVLVTGATGGLGRYTAIGLARLGATVIVHGRSLDRAEAAAEEVRAWGGDQVFAVAADLSSQVEVRRLAAEVAAAHPRLHVLVNNAGLWKFGTERSVDGIELTLAVNHLASFLLTNLLLDNLRAASPARVVTVSSEAHRAGLLDPDRVLAQRGFDNPGAYGQSKLANIFFTAELARRLDGTGVTANCLHPGIIAGTALWRGFGPLRLLFPLVAPLFPSPERGARTSIRLASAPDLEAVTGRYFLSNGRPGTPSPVAQDPHMAARLWEVSEQLTGYPHA
ncbi:MAG: retinol dehydrogenase 14 [Chloroflexota bacterium]|jgi:NAD(P)-dependent dehydrogenase (short-subunit alcohol dehydrogenase family)|nr:retinol dehydrogenase 14 [Chloroflexota bacterium]